jgi:hypothetical protein
MASFSPTMVRYLTDVTDHALNFSHGFHRQVANTLRGIRFASISGCVTYEEILLHAYYPGDVFTVGQVQAQGGEFHVVSEHIQNMRYAAVSTRRHVAQSKNRDKDARKYLRRDTPFKVLCRTYKEFLREANNAPRSVWNEFSRAREDLLGGSLTVPKPTGNLEHADPMFGLLLDVHRHPEKYQSLELGYDDTLRAQLMKYITAGQEWMDYAAEHSGTAYFVLRLPGRDGDKFYVQSVDPSSRTSVSNLPEDGVLHTEQTLPDGLIGRLSVLSILAEGVSFLDGVGYRVDTNCAYVYE